MERTSIDGAEIAYEVVGTGEPVVFIHGAFIADTFRPLLVEPGLTESYRLILYHRRGYAGSSQPSSMVGIAQHVADCRALLRHLDVERAHVVGHSYGGAVALQLALDAPDLVHSLALLEPALMVGASAQGYRDCWCAAWTATDRQAPRWWWTSSWKRARPATAPSSTARCPVPSTRP